MEIKDEELQTLKSLGLTGRQAQIFLALVQLNTYSSVTVISRNSNVGREDVYKIMPTLQKLCLVEKAVTMPTKYKAVPIQEAISKLMENKINQVTELKSKTTKLIQKFRKNNNRNENQKDTPQFVLIPKKEAVIRWILKALENTKATNEIVGNVKNVNEMIYFWGEHFKKALENGVKFRFIVSKLENTKTEIILDEQLKNNPNFQIRYTSDTPLVSLAIHDNKKAIISTVPMNPNESPCLVSNNPVFVATLHDYFETQWKTASENAT